MSTRDSLRNYGLPNVTPIGKPTWKKAVPLGGHDPLCPNCGAWLCEIEVLVKTPLVRGGEGLCRYLGCPACPFASPSVTTSMPTVSMKPEVEQKPR